MSYATGHNSLRSLSSTHTYIYRRQCRLYIINVGGDGCVPTRRLFWNFQHTDLIWLTWLRWFTFEKLLFWLYFLISFLFRVLSERILFVQQRDYLTYIDRRLGSSVLWMLLVNIGSIEIDKRTFLLHCDPHSSISFLLLMLWCVTRFRTHTR
jgi:hypothetical protein